VKVFSLKEFKRNWKIVLVLLSSAFIIFPAMTYFLNKSIWQAVHQLIFTLTIVISIFGYAIIFAKLFPRIVHSFPILGYWIWMLSSFFLVSFIVFIDQNIQHYFDWNYQ